MRTRPLLIFTIVLAGPLRAAQADTFDKQVSAEPRGSVVVSSVGGSISVTGWDKPQVDVHAVVGSGQQVEVTSGSGHVDIRVIRTGQYSWHGGGDAQLTVRIPQGSELEVIAVSAELKSSGVLGVQRLQTVSGRIDADLATDADVKTVSGELRLRGGGRPAHLRINSVSGDVSLINAAGELEATTVSGMLRAVLSPATSVRAHTTSGDLTVGGKLARGITVDAQTISGEVSLHAPTEAGFEYDVSTFSGDIRNCFGQEAWRTSTYGPGKQLSGKRGNGEGRLRIKTLSGEIDLCDR
jgi:DUF4097 and DUF4098 domain-containing protein YvlB